ncbi:MAG TPA: type II toxin-antitoxin system VapB family antitoxin [Xanthobacteraceae bacterium]|nr:type II toxin-antitoxin system VapB family antitoxin [Xanthobacteraceae bacterium]
MGILIKRPDAEAKIRELAARTGETITEAVERAVDERLARLPPPRRKGRIDRKKLAELHAYFDSLPRMNEHLSDEDIVGYDEDGVPK